MKNVVLSSLLLLSSLSVRAEYLAVVNLHSPLTIQIEEGEKPSINFIASIRDTLSAYLENADTLTYLTRYGILKIKLQKSNSQLLYYFAGIWRKTILYPVFNDSMQIPKEGFFKDSNGNVAWLKWSKSLNLPLLYSPYRKYRSYLIPLGKNEYFNSVGDRIILDKEDLIYTLRNTSEIVELKPFVPYVREEVYAVVHGDSLFGYFYRPFLKELIPGCLLLQGGGSIGIENYLLEAEFLAAHGVATAVFNKSGEERSKGNTSFRLQSFNEKLNEYALLYEWLISRRGIDQKRTGIHGMSEGGRLSVDLAARLGDQVAFVISVSGPFSSFSDNQLYAINRYLHRALWPDSVVAATTALWARYYHEVTKDSISHEMEQAITALRTLYPRLYLPPDGRLPAGDLRKEDIKFTSSLSLSKVKAPILFQLADFDQRVDVYRTANLIRQHRTNSKDWLRFYPETSHGMMDSQGNITSGYLYEKVEWLKSINVINP